MHYISFAFSVVLPATLPVHPCSSEALAPIFTFALARLGPLGYPPESLKAGPGFPTGPPKFASVLPPIPPQKKVPLVISGGTQSG